MKKLVVPGGTAGDRSAHYAAFSNKNLGSCNLSNIVLTLVLFLFSLQSVSAQNTDTSSIAAERYVYCFYMHKYQVNNTAGLLFLIPGLTLMAIESADNAVHINHVFKYGYNTSTGTKLFFLGSAIALTSVPFFISAGKYKARAYLSLKRGGIQITERGPGNFHYAAINLKIKF